MKELKVEVMLFASFKEIAGEELVEVSLPENSVLTVGLLKEALAVQFPALAGRLASGMFAVNETVARDEDEFSVDDRVAAMPPVSGGICT